MFCGPDSGSSPSTLATPSAARMCASDGTSGMRPSNRADDSPITPTIAGVVGGARLERLVEDDQ